MPKEIIRRALNEEQSVEANAEMQAKELENAGEQIDEAIAASQRSDVDLAATQFISGIANAYASYRMQMDAFNANELLSKYTNKINKETTGLDNLSMEQLNELAEGKSLSFIESEFDNAISKYSPKIQLKAREALQAKLGESMVNLQEHRMKRLNAALKNKITNAGDLIEAAVYAGGDPNPVNVAKTQFALQPEHVQQLVIQTLVDKKKTAKVNKAIKNGKAKDLTELRKDATPALKKLISKNFDATKKKAIDNVHSAILDLKTTKDFVKLPAMIAQTNDAKTKARGEEYIEFMKDMVNNGGMTLAETDAQFRKTFSSIWDEEDVEKSLKNSKDFAKRNYYGLYPLVNEGASAKDVSWETRKSMGIMAAPVEDLVMVHQKVTGFIAQNKFKEIDNTLAEVANKYGSDAKAVLRHSAKTALANAKFNTSDYYRAMAVQIYATNPSLFDKKDLTQLARVADKLPGIIPKGKIDPSTKVAEFLSRQLAPDAIKDLMQQVKTITAAKRFATSESKAAPDTEDYADEFYKDARDNLYDIVDGNMGKRAIGISSSVPAGLTQDQLDDMSKDEKKNYEGQLLGYTTAEGLENKVYEDFKERLELFDSFLLQKNSDGDYEVFGEKDGVIESVPDKEGAPTIFDPEVSRTPASQIHPGEDYNFSQDNVRKTLQNLNAGRSPDNLVAINQTKMEEQRNWVHKRVDRKTVLAAELFANKYGITSDELTLGFLTIAAETNFVEKYAKERGVTTTLSKEKLSVKGYGNFETATNEEAMKEWDKHFAGKVEFDPNNFGHVAVKIALFKKKRSLDYLSTIIKKNHKMLDVVKNMSYGHLARYQARIYNGTRSYKDEDTLVGVATDRGHSYNPIDPKYDGSRENAEYAFSTMGALYASKSMDVALGQQDRNKKGKRASVLLTRNTGTVAGLADSGVDVNQLMRVLEMPVHSTKFYSQLLQRLRQEGINVKP